MEADPANVQRSVFRLHEGIFISPQSAPGSLLVLFSLSCLSKLKFSLTDYFSVEMRFLLLFKHIEIGILSFLKM